MKKYLGLSVLALSLSFAQAPMAFADSEHKCFGNGEHFRKVVETLNLTAEQKTKIQAIREQAKKDIDAKHEELRKIRMQINDAYRDKTMDSSKIDSFVTQKKDIIGDIMKVRMTERYDISNVLTDEQKTKLVDMMKSWEEKHQKDND